MLKKETKTDFGYYLLDVSKFVVAGVIIENVFNKSGISIAWAFGAVGAFVIAGIIIIDKTRG